MSGRRCSCKDFGDAVGDGFISPQIWQRNGKARTYYALNDPSGEVADRVLIAYCPFCGFPVGDGLDLLPADDPRRAEQDAEGEA